jgi:CRP/FNR family transcriptional regulator, cyclic AMP receptor protein
MARNAYLARLKSVPLFADLDDHELDLVDRSVTEVNVRAGHVLMQEGQTAHEMVVVVDGSLDVVRGGEHVATLGPGDFAGEMALLAHSHRHATVTATADSKLLVIEGREFLSVVTDAPHLAVKMLPIVAQRVVENTENYTH